MRAHVVQAILIGAIAGAVPVVSGLAPSNRGEYVPVAEYYWLHKY